ncbi:MAG: hypothetical protein QM786_05950 [Breznakibacter sp.]
MEELLKVKDASRRIENMVAGWENVLLGLDEERITRYRNKQHRNIKQILGHLIDSSANNHHRIVRLQYGKRLVFPDYQADNDTWIGIQKYEDKDWYELVQLWKLYGLHIAFIIRRIEAKDLCNLWTDGFITPITLEEIASGFPNHFELHLNEIKELMESK